MHPVLGELPISGKTSAKHEINKNRCHRIHHAVFPGPALDLTERRCSNCGVEGNQGELQASLQDQPQMVRIRVFHGGGLTLGKVTDQSIFHMFREYLPGFMASLKLCNTTRNVHFSLDVQIASDLGQFKSRILRA